MVEYKVLTVRDVNFVDDSKKEVKGLQLWCSFPSDAPGWRGTEVAKLWFPSDSIFVDRVSALQPGAVVALTFNRYGKVASLEVLSDA